MNKLKYLSVSFFAISLLFIADSVCALSVISKVISKGTPPQVDLVVKRIEVSPGFSVSETNYSGDPVIQCPCLSIRNESLDQTEAIIEKEGVDIKIKRGEGRNLSLFSDSKLVNVCNAGYYSDCTQKMENYSGVGSLQIFRPEKTFLLVFDNYMEKGENISVPDWKVSGEVIDKEKGNVRTGFTVYGNFNVLPPSEDWLENNTKFNKIFDKYDPGEIYGYAGMFIVILLFLAAIISIIKYFVIKKYDRKNIYLAHAKYSFIALLLSISLFNRTWYLQRNYYNYDLTMLLLSFSNSILSYSGPLLILITMYGLARYLIAAARKDNEKMQKAKMIIGSSLRFLLFVLIIYIMVMSSRIYY